MKKTLVITILFVMVALLATTVVNATTSSELADTLYNLGSKYGMTSSDKVKIERYLSDNPVTDDEANQIVAKAQEAVAILEHMPDKGAFESLKVLKSAIANAENNMGKNVETLIVKEAYATSGPQFKRMSAKAKGQGSIILKRTSHITIVLDEVVGG